MPGTIQVSVLDFQGLGSSSTPSSIFIKVSMGKREYKTWDKGDFSFPLTTLRDSLIVTLQDAEGSEISHIGVQSISIVEKGTWDDLFPLEGGGHVHMKLQFILSEDERNRIRGVRETALKKKKGDVLNYNLKYSKETSGVGDSVTSSASINHEVSAKQGGPLSSPDTFLQDSQSNNGKQEASILKQITPNATDRREESPFETISGVEVHHISSVEKTEIQLPHADVTSSSILSKDDSSVSRGTQPVISLKNKPVNFNLEAPEVHHISSEEKTEILLPHDDVSLSTSFPKDDSSMPDSSKPAFVVKNKSVLFNLEDNPFNKQAKQSPMRKPPSSVRKMISAFETSLVQERLPPIVQVVAKSQANKAGKEDPLKDQELRRVTREAESISGRLGKPTELSSVRLKNPGESSTCKFENPVESSSRKLENPAESSLRPGDLVESSTVETKSRPKINPGKLRNPFLAEKLQKLPPLNVNTEEHISSGKEFDGSKPSLATMQFIESSTLEVPPEKEGASRSAMMTSHKEKKREPKKSPESSITSFSEPDRHIIQPEETEKHVGFGKDLSDYESPRIIREVKESHASEVQSKEALSFRKSELKSDDEEVIRKGNESSKGLLNSSNSNGATFLEQKEHMTIGGHQPSHFDDEKKDSGAPLLTEGGGDGTNSNISSDILVASNGKLKSVVYPKGEQYHYESSGVWIFPDETRHPCIATGAAEVRLDGGSRAEGKKSFSVPGKLEKHEVQNENSSHEIRKSIPESSVNDAFSGTVKQAIKIAIIIGFGTLVLFTRQRAPRKNRRIANDPFFTKLDYIGVQTAMEE